MSSSFICHPQSISLLVSSYLCVFVFLVCCVEVRHEIWACTRNDRSTETYTHKLIQRTHHTQRADIWVTSFLGQVALNTIPASSSRVRSVEISLLNLFATSTPVQNFKGKSIFGVSSLGLCIIRGPGPGDEDGQRGWSGYLLGTPLFCTLTLVVDPAEIGHDDGHRKSDHQHATQRTNRAEDLSHNGLGNHVSISVTHTKREIVLFLKYLHVGISENLLYVCPQFQIFTNLVDFLQPG